jgi:phosphate transport system protein
MPNHTTIAFDADLETIRSEIRDMGGAVQRQVADAGIALMRHDAEIARSVIALDADVDRLLREIETKVVETIACRQPFAVDLREVVSAFHIASDLERVGDLAKSVCKRVLALDARAPGALTSSIAALSSLVLGRLQRVLGSYADRDDAEAADVWGSDQEIDEAHNAIFGELLVFMMSDPRNIGSSTHLLFCLKNIERMGDHATNIAEAVHYMVTGGRFAADRPKGSDASLRIAPQ